MPDTITCPSWCTKCYVDTDGSHLVHAIDDLEVTGGDRSVYFTLAQETDHHTGELKEKGVQLKVEMREFGSITEAREALAWATELLDKYEAKD